MTRKLHTGIMSSLSLLMLLGTAHAATPEIANTQKQRPNIILFMVDDMGWQDTSVPFWHDKEGKPVETFLNKRYKTPNMEKLAEQGMKFTQAYAQPICSPTRVSLMTGMNSAAHRVTNWTLNRDQVTDANHPQVVSAKDWNMNGLQPVGTGKKGKMVTPIENKQISYEMNKPYVVGKSFPEILQKNGYVTIHCGKAHFGSKNTPGANPLNFGFTYNIAGTEIGGPADYRGGQKYGSGPFHVQGLDENQYYQDDVFLTEALTIEALKRLKEIKDNPKEKDKPFYLYMAHYAIHAPFDQRGYDKRFADQYKNPNDGKPWSDNEKRYAGLIEGMDKSLGDIMAFLKENNLDENTIIIFMSDNGGLAISGRMGNKWTNYPLSAGKGALKEGGIREPMIIRWPNVTKPNSISNQQVIIEDFYPTILEMAGISKPKTPQKIDGVSFAPILKGAQATSKKPRPLLFHKPNTWGEGGWGDVYAPGTALIYGDWKLIYTHTNQNIELYNIKDDISEEHNLALDKPEKLKEMAQLMDKELKSKNAQMPTYKANNPAEAPAESLVPSPVKAVANYLAKNKK